MLLILYCECTNKRLFYLKEKAHNSNRREMYNMYVYNTFCIENNGDLFPKCQTACIFYQNVYNTEVYTEFRNNK